MKTSRKLATTVVILVSMLILAGRLHCIYASDGGMAAFVDSEMPGIRIQVNATAETQPSKNLTVILRLSTQTDVYIERLSLAVYGFLNGTIRTLLGNITNSSFSLNNTSHEYGSTFNVPDQVWGTTYGEIGLTYVASFGGLDLRFPNITNGFPMTQVENTFLENLENQVNDLNSSLAQLNSLYMNLTGTFQQLNQTYWELHQNYTSVQGSLGELDTTRRLTAILAITTVFFLATTLFLVFRRPREPW